MFSLHLILLNQGPILKKTYYTIGQIYKLVLKLDNILWWRKSFVRILVHYTLKYLLSYFFDRGTISNLGTLFYTSQRLKLLYRIGPWLGAWPTTAPSTALCFSLVLSSLITFPFHFPAYFAVAGQKRPNTQIGFWPTNPKNNFRWKLFGFFGLIFGLEHLMETF